MTFRFYGHVFGDDDAYMGKEEKAAAMAKDPLILFRARLIANDVAGEDRLAEIDATIAAQIEDAIQFALSSALPPLEELTTDVYAEAGAA
jgi:pyruvate dehydrogenase E1 component alpha subunit